MPWHFKSIANSLCCGERLSLYRDLQLLWKRGRKSRRLWRCDQLSRCWTLWSDRIIASKRCIETRRVFLVTILIVFVRAKGYQITPEVCWSSKCLFSCKQSKSHSSKSGLLASFSEAKEELQGANKDGEASAIARWIWRKWRPFTAVKPQEKRPFF